MPTTLLGLEARHGQEGRGYPIEPCPQDSGRLNDMVIISSALGSNTSNLSFTSDRGDRRHGLTSLYSVSHQQPLWNPVACGPRVSPSPGFRVHSVWRSCPGPGSEPAPGPDPGGCVVAAQSVGRLLHASQEPTVLSTTVTASMMCPGKCELPAQVRCRPEYQ